MEPLPESVHPGWPLPFVPQDWEHTPAAVHAYVHTLHDELAQLRARVDALEPVSYTHLTLPTILRV